MSTAGSNPPGYEFRDESTFELARGNLGLSEDEIDDHLRQIEQTLLKDPVEWSGYLASNPLLRTAVSDSTSHSPNALRIIFRINGTIIERLHVERRGFTPNSDDDA